MMKIFKTLVVLAFFGTASVAAVIIGAVIHYSNSLPQLITVKEYKPLLVTEVYASNKEKIGEFSLQRRYVLPYDKIPKQLVHAFIASEDSSFFRHHGIDFVGIIRAMIINIFAGRFKQGASTITQQVARSLLLSREKTMSRKIKEAILAYRMENNLSKEDILYLYLNQIYLGHAAYGVGAAAQIYFGKNVADLNLSEMAILAGLPQAPGRYTPLDNPQKSKQRQAYVLNRMWQDGYINSDQQKEALQEPIKIIEPGKMNEQIAPYFTEHVRKYLFEKLGAAKVLEEGLKVFTTIDIEAQLNAQKQVSQGLHLVDKKRGFRGAIDFVSTPQAMLDWKQKSHEKLVNQAQPFKMLLGDGKLVSGHEWLEQTLMKDKEAANSIERLGGVEANKPVTPLKLNTLYQGLVTEVMDQTDLNKAYTKINLGYRECIIPLQSMRWARKLNPKVSMYAELLSKPSDVLKVGDVVYVRVNHWKYEGGALQGNFMECELDQIPEVQGALIAYDIKNQTLKSMVGGYDYTVTLSEFNRAIQAQRQPGSAFKPFVYSAALDNGYTPSTIIVDSPIVYETEEQAFASHWKPENFEKKFFGETTLMSALMHSRNIITIKLLQQLKPAYLANYVRRFGIDSKLNLDLSLALGSSALSLDELVRASAVFPNGGKKFVPYFIEKVVDQAGTILAQNAGTPAPVTIDDKNVPADILEKLPKFDDPNQVIAPQTAYLMTQLLRLVMKHGTAHDIGAQLDRVAAGKTGTTSDYGDALFVGFTPGTIAGVWVGFDELQPIYSGATGGSCAGPIWLDFIKALPPDEEEDFVHPEGIIKANVDLDTGKLATSKSVHRILMSYKEGTEPQEAGNGSQTLIDPKQQIDRNDLNLED